MSNDLQNIQADIIETTKTLFGEVKAATDKNAEELRRMSSAFADIQAEMRRPGIPQSKAVGGLNGWKTPGSRIVELKDALEMFEKSGRVKIAIGDLFPSFETKTLIDSSAVGFSTPGILGAERLQSEIVPLARRRLTIRDILRTKKVTGAAVDFVRENVFTNAASPQAEGSAKGESADTLIIGSERIRTIAHWIPVTKQVMDDLPELMAYIDGTLVYGLKIKEEAEILSGDNLGNHYHGLIGQATAYAGTYAVAGDTKLDRIRHAILELEAADEACTAIVLNPRDAHDIDLLKTEEGGANKGSYVVSDALGGTLNVRTYWGRPVVVTNSIASGKMLIGDFTKVILADRQDATVEVSDSHDTFFTSNKLAIRAELRGAVCLTRATALLYASI